MIGRSKRRIGRGATREVEAEWEVEKKNEMEESKTELVVGEERKESSRRHRIDR